MSRILFVNACVRSESRTRFLAGRLLAMLGGEYDEVNVTDGTLRPLDRQTLEKRTENIGRGAFSDSMFAPARQFAQAETIVIAAPFWDLSFPSFLKVYLENILVSGVTFTYQNGRPEGLCRAKRLYYVTTAGGALSPDFGFSYVKALAESFFEIPEIRRFAAEGLDIVGNDVERLLKEAEETMRCAL